ncbi:MAG TPA: universal stress protein [Methylomirabilota bacterium]|jgi:nucleotide-binding universal stress UspA family protein|nr:universal stress protein [Methylomirabilota bacterium]
MKFGTILVPLDGSALAEAALPRALELAELSGARMLLLRAAQAQTLPGVDPTEAQVRVVSEAEAYLAQLKTRLSRESRVTVETSVWYGPPARAIVEGARLHRAGEIVMTTHGRSGLGRLLLGSVTESVLRGTTTPILVIHAEGAAIEAPGGQAGPWKAA